jgi:general secretion pathway protein G
MVITKHRNQQGFTLVELLIVVIILGILAAVVIPQFNSAASESKEAALASNLATIRQAVEMYKVQHNDAYPAATMVAQLTAGTALDGTAGTAYGPYLRNSFPKNPINGLATVNAVTTDPVAGDGSHGWEYNTVTGQFWADEAGAGPSGVNYFDL